MHTRVSTTPFGRRPLSLAMVATQAAARATEPGAAVHKWLVYRAVCEAKVALGIGDRALAVLNALLTFHPETVLTAAASRRMMATARNRAGWWSFRRTISSRFELTAWRRRHYGVIWRCWFIVDY